MTFTISPAVEADIPEIADVANIGFKDDPIMGLLIKGCSPGDIRKRDIEAHGRFFSESDGHQHFTKVIDSETRQLVAFCKWRSPTGQVAEQTTKPPDGYKEIQIDGFNYALSKEFGVHLVASRKAYLDLTKDYYIVMIATLPSYQRKGLGKRLLQHVTDLADRDGAKTYLHASAVGSPLYARLGWEQVGRFELDLDQFGGKGREEVKCMIRPPQVGVSPT